MKRWLQFGLRSLILWMALLGLMLGWWLDHHDLARQSEDAKNVAKEELRKRLIWEVRYKTLRVGLEQIGLGLEHHGPVISDDSLDELLAKKQEVQEDLHKENMDIGWMDDLRPAWRSKPPKPSPSPTPESIRRRMEFFERLRGSTGDTPTTPNANPKKQP